MLNFAPAIKISALSDKQTISALVAVGTYTPSGSPSQTSMTRPPIFLYFSPSISISTKPVAGTIHVSYPGTKYSNACPFFILTILK